MIHGRPVAGRRMENADSHGLVRDKSTLDTVRS